jgi:VWFA-related protein
MTADPATTWILLLWVRATVILLLGGAFVLLLRRSSSAARHAVLGLTVAALLVLPVVTVVLPHWELAILPGTSSRTEAIQSRVVVAPSTREVPARRPMPAPADRSPKATAAVTAPSGNAPTLSDVRDQRRPPEAVSSRPSVGSALAWLVGAWLAGAAIGVVQIVRSSLRVQKTLRRAAELAEPEWQDELNRAARTLGLQRRVRLMTSDTVRVPVVHGFRLPTIVLPTGAGDWPEDRRRAFLIHELAHVRRQDWPVQMLGHLARALYWPHPLVWWVVRRLRAEAERACDDCVLLSGTSASDYADHLLQAARDLGRTPPQVVLAAVERSYFEDRLVALLDPQVSRRPVGPRLLACAAVAALALVVGLAGVHPVARALAAAPERAAAHAGVSSPRPEVRSSPGGRAASESARPDRSASVDAPTPGPSDSRATAKAGESERAPVVVPASDGDEQEAPSEDGAESEEGVATLPIGQAVSLPQPAAVARPVIRISTDLVQIDAVITDNDGRGVVDLRPEDIEVYEDGRKQTISHFQYVAAGPGTSGKGVAAPAASATPGEPRSFVFVVDNLGLPLEGIARARRLIKSFVTSGLQPRDRAAIIETSKTKGGTFLLTSDPKLLSEAADRIHAIVWGRALLGSFGGRELDLTSRHDQLTMQSIAVLKNTIDALRAHPGRKSVILVSDGFAARITVDMDRLLQRFTTTPLDSLYGDDSMWAALRSLTDQANRASVVIYTLDSTGLQTSGTSFGTTQRLMTGSVRNPTNTATVGDVRDDDGLLVTGYGASRESLVRSAVRTAREDSLIEIAEQTGGLAVISQNDLDGGLKRIVDDLSGYYLIGYVPEQATFEARPGPPPFHSVKVEVKRPGLKVRSRKGFYGVTDELVAQEAPPQ